MISRRSLLGSGGAAVLAARITNASESTLGKPLQEFEYGAVQLAPGQAQSQFENTQAVLLALNEDSLLKPFRLRAGLPAPGPEIGGWYDEVPLMKTDSGGHGFAPAHSFGQWISALARGYAAYRDVSTRAKLQRLLDLYEPAISSRFYKNFRFPAYNYDKLVIGLLDAHRYANIPQAMGLLERTTDAAEPHLPPRALDRDEPQRQWRQAAGEYSGNDYTWDESYTLPENLYLAWESGAGERYKSLAARFLLDRTYFDPLAENRNVLADHHAYSFCNALSSAMQAYLAAGSKKHLQAASNAFDMITETQSFATGGWGPNESFSEPGSGKLYASLSGTHRGFETPCGSYAHFKLTRYLLRVYRDGRYGDSMERVFYNTVLGAKPLQSDGHAFYYSDYHSSGSKSYFHDAWPCCSGTLPQVAADYRKMIYFRDDDRILVNLYLPSTLNWITNDGAKFVLQQTGAYPVEGGIKIRFEANRAASFGLSFRIPAWSQGNAYSLRVNGQHAAASLRKGFATIHRKWRGGDTVELRLSLPMRTEAIDRQHPDTVALMRGPLVLFAKSEDLPRITAEQMRAAVKMPDQAAWQAGTGSSQRLRFVPFTGIEDERYTTYLHVT